MANAQPFIIFILLNWLDVCHDATRVLYTLATDSVIPISLKFYPIFYHFKKELLADVDKDKNYFLGELQKQNDAIESMKHEQRGELNL